jgi:two-component system, LytTR family, response regulator
MKNDITAIIVEDVESYLYTIEKLVLQTSPELKIVGKSTTLNHAKMLIERFSPAILFLDIQFEEEGKTAFDMLNELGEECQRQMQIIFITAHQEKSYYAKAFDYGALHFLEKPIDTDKLKSAIERAVQNHKTRGSEDWVSQVNHLQAQLGPLTGKIAVESSKFTELINIESLVLLEASGRYTTLYLSDGKTILSSRNLGEYEKKLENNPVFFRIHHNKIINMGYIKRFSRKERIIELSAPVENQQASKERFKLFVRFMEG